MRTDDCVCTNVYVCLFMYDCVCMIMMYRDVMCMIVCDWLCVCVCYYCVYDRPCMQLCTYSYVSFNYGCSHAQYLWWYFLLAMVILIQHYLYLQYKYIYIRVWLCVCASISPCVRDFLHVWAHTYMQVCAYMCNAQSCNATDVCYVRILWDFIYVGNVM